MNKQRIDIKAFIAKAKKEIKVASKHASFIGIMVVLVAYLIVVWKISNLASAEPTPTAAQSASSSIPKIDKDAVKQIQALEQNNTQIHSLFNQARTNPFQE